MKSVANDPSDDTPESLYNVKALLSTKNGQG